MASRMQEDEALFQDARDLFARRVLRPLKKTYWEPGTKTEPPGACFLVAAWAAQANQVGRFEAWAYETECRTNPTRRDGDQWVRWRSLIARGLERPEDWVFGACEGFDLHDSKIEPDWKAYSEAFRDGWNYGRECARRLVSLGILADARTTK